MFAVAHTSVTAKGFAVSRMIRMEALSKGFVLLASTSFWLAGHAQSLIRHEATTFSGTGCPNGGAHAISEDGTVLYSFTTMHAKSNEMAVCKSLSKFSYPRGIHRINVQRTLVGTVMDATEAKPEIFQTGSLFGVALRRLSFSGSGELITNEDVEVRNCDGETPQRDLKLVSVARLLGDESFSGDVSLDTFKVQLKVVRTRSCATE
jgi:hypothetical protein